MRPLLERQAPNAASALQPACPAPAAAGPVCLSCSPDSPTRLLGGSARSTFHPGDDLGCLLLSGCGASDLHGCTAGASWLSMSHSGETDASGTWPDAFPGASLHSQSGKGDSARGAAEGAASPANLSCRGDTGC